MSAANQLIRYRRNGGGGGRSDNIVTDSSSNSNNGAGEDWITKKRVETKTTRNVEKRVQRQLVLEDGRIIEQDDPEVTVDVVEDAQSHSDDGNEDRRVVVGGGGLDSTGAKLLADWHPGGGGRTLGEKRQRNVYTTDVKQRSSSTTSALNVGDISSKDVNKIIKEGRSSKTFIRPYDAGDKVTIAPRLTHAHSSQNRVVDTENVQEVQRVHDDGKVKTDRFVSRECVEDFNEETPSDGESGSEPEVRDGDRDSFSQRKEDKFVDYYSVPRGKSVREGKFLRHGIHMTSHDKHNGNGSVDRGRRAIPYSGDSAGELRSGRRKPPVSRNKRRGDRVSSSERERESTKSPGPGDFHVRYSKISPKFHTIERSGGGGNARRRRSEAMRSDNSDSSFPRSGSISRRPTHLPAPPLKGNLKRSSEIGHHRSVGNLRNDSEGERSSSSGRLKRTKSFTMHPSGEGKSLFGSFKSLYASLTKSSSKKEKENKVSAANRAWFDRGDGRQPKPPPRKARSRTQSDMSTIAGGGGGGGSSFDVRESSGNNRRWEMYSSSVHLAADQPHARRRRQTYNPPARSPPPRPAVFPRTVSESAASLARRRRSRAEPGNASASSSVNNLHPIDRREPKRFEEERQQKGQVKSRFFGQQDDSDPEEGGKRHERPPPDMRRLLLNNVNLTRSKSMSKNPEQTPSLIRSM